MKLLTVTVPCYNSQDYMENCIESLLVGGDQVEIIIIDDGSRDLTGTIADRYAAMYPDIVKVIHQENGGHGEGINQGVRHATGKYFKVVDSDDTLSADFPRFLELLADCDRRGGVDLFVTNYYYVHSDGKGDRSIRYTNALPEGRIFHWDETRGFRMHQLLTIHSCTFRTALMRDWNRELPKHLFYEDNLMVCQTLPDVKSIYYMDADLYRYWIGRPDQSVQKEVMLKRYSHQLQVAQRCFEAVRLDEISDRRLQKYLDHELFMMFGIGILYARLNFTEETDQAVEQMWEACRQHDEIQADHFRKGSLLRFLCIRGTIGWLMCRLVYWFAYKVVRFT